MTTARKPGRKTRGAPLEGSVKPGRKRRVSAIKNSAATRNDCKCGGGKLVFDADSGGWSCDSETCYVFIPAEKSLEGTSDAPLKVGGKMKVIARQDSDGDYRTFLYFPEKHVIVELPVAEALVSTSVTRMGVSVTFPTSADTIITDAEGKKIDP